MRRDLTQRPISLGEVAACRAVEEPRMSLWTLLIVVLIIILVIFVVTRLR